MGTNTTNPSADPRPCPAQALIDLESAVVSIGSIHALLDALASATVEEQPEALYPIADALHRAHAQAVRAREVLDPRINGQAATRAVPDAVAAGGRKA